MKHQINETHLGDSATPEQAKQMAAILTENGYPSEYNPAQGCHVWFTDPETGEDKDIPDVSWQRALTGITV